ncbi:hypothetical protein BKA56DRAFT_589175 [Ilyonectria sp. MPI-CAGE-AT-0026]|nr:hypothetical protein BKA56DRAFT_589175 [Ilyonectria sp. MPI-CAGE-AT-0026]
MWPDSIKRIEIVQRDIGPRLIHGDRPESARFAAIVAGHSFKLEELAVCHYIDASDFFEETQRLQALQPRPWNNLLSLALTFDRVSAHIRPPWIVGGNPQELAQLDRFLDSLFHKAGEAAKLMPVLRTMTLLNCNYIFNGDFKYEASNGNATVRWTCTWPIQLSDRVRQVWGEVAQQRNFQLQILSESIDELRLCDSVIYSLSNRD